MTRKWIDDKVHNYPEEKVQPQDVSQRSFLVNMRISEARFE